MSEIFITHDFFFFLFFTKAKLNSFLKYTKSTQIEITENIYKNTIKRMGKKGKASKKPAAVKVPEPPFLFRVDNFSEDKGECALHIYDNTDVHFQEIEIEVGRATWGRTG